MDYGTHRTETLALLNSLAASCGYNDSKLPFPNLSVPTLPPLNERGCFGFAASNLTEDEFLRQYTGLQPGIMTEDNGEDEDADPKEPSPDEVLEELEEQEAAEQDEQEAGVTDEISCEDDPAIQAEIERITPLIRPNKTTAQAFARLTNQQPWYPFHTGSTTPLEIHLEEFAVFNSMEPRCKRNVRPRAKDGYHAFSNEWNVEVANRYTRHVEDEKVILIRRKSAIQLHCRNILIIFNKRNEWLRCQTQKPIV